MSEQKRTKTEHNRTKQNTIQLQNKFTKIIENQVVKNKYNGWLNWLRLGERRMDSGIRFHRKILFTKKKTSIYSE